jgi:small subunit ribosomal protein S4e
MHQTRQQATTRLPIERKGTKYVVRSSSNLENSVPVLIAIRDILGLAQTKKEVKKMIKQKLLKINGREVIDYNEGINLFSILEAGRSYVLKVTPTKRFTLEETKDGKERLCKVTGKKLITGGKIQLCMHDGTNILGDKKIKIGDSLYLDLSAKIKKHVSIDKGSSVFIISGRYEGQLGKVESIVDNKVSVKFKEGSAVLNQNSVVAL